MNRLREKKTKMLTVGPKIPYLPILDKALIFIKKWAPSFLCLFNPNFIQKHGKSNDKILRNECYRQMERRMDGQS